MAAELQNDGTQLMCLSGTQPVAMAMAGICAPAGYCFPVTSLFHSLAHTKKASASAALCGKMCSAYKTLLSPPALPRWIPLGVSDSREHQYCTESAC